MKFTTRSDIDAYLGGDRITCLECGRVFKTLGEHISKIHGLSAREYKIKYGIPQRDGLTCATFRRARSAWATQQYAAGVLNQSGLDKSHVAPAKCAKPKYQQDKFMARGRECSQARKYKPDFFEGILVQIQAGATAAAACRTLEGRDASASLWAYAAKNPEFNARLRAATKISRGRGISAAYAKKVGS